LKVIGTHRPIAIAMVVVLYVLGPLVFRYALLSSMLEGYPAQNYYALGNATMDLRTDWTCAKCNDTVGMTIKNILVDFANVTNPKMDAGQPSLAVFVSQDFIEWKNYFAPDNDNSYAFVDEETRTISINQTLSTGSCLGPIANTYVVACLNLEALAFSVPKSHAVVGPPFDDRCFQMDTACGVPCIDATPNYVDIPYCTDGKIDLSWLTTVNSTVNVMKEAGIEQGWGSALNFFDWLVLIVIFLDTFGNMLRFLPIISGRPFEWVRRAHS
jgi:hypothetical protein